jgi:hypothetical protein
VRIDAHGDVAAVAARALAALGRPSPRAAR